MTATTDAQQEDSAELQVSNPVLGSIRTKGYRLMDIAWVGIACAIAYGAWELKAHAGDSAQQNAAIVKSITEANSAIVQALKEQQAVAKESNTATVRVLERLTMAQAEANCLLDPLMKNRNDAREFCKRVSGRDER